MKIAEVFYSIQGEGRLAGTPSVFLRTSGCNLRCVWCDTPYTSWSPEGKEWTLEELLAWVRRQGCPYVVITGGEPMIQPELETLCAGLRGLCSHITIETAGTVYRDLACDLMSISPKLANATPWEPEDGRWAAQHDRLRLQPSVLRRLLLRYDCQLKFVVQQPADLAEIRGIVKEIGASPSQVMLMAEGTTPCDIHDREEWIVEACKSLGYRYSPRLHVMIWGNRRGV